MIVVFKQDMVLEENPSMPKCNLAKTVHHINGMQC